MPELTVTLDVGGDHSFHSGRLAHVMLHPEPAPAHLAHHARGTTRVESAAARIACLAEVARFTDAAQGDPARAAVTSVDLSARQLRVAARTFALPDWTAEWGTLAARGPVVVALSAYPLPWDRTACQHLDDCTRPFLSGRMWVGFAEAV